MAGKSQQSVAEKAEKTCCFLYAILQQLNMKPVSRKPTSVVPRVDMIIFQLKLFTKTQVDWNLVALQLDIPNGHAARMRYSRVRERMGSKSLLRQTMMGSGIGKWTRKTKHRSLKHSKSASPPVVPKKEPVSIGNDNSKGENSVGMGQADSTIIKPDGAEDLSNLSMIPLEPYPFPIMGSPLQSAPSSPLHDFSANQYPPMDAIAPTDVILAPDLDSIRSGYQWECHTDIQGRDSWSVTQAIS